MKKFFIIFSIFIGLIVALAYFSTTEFFFNRYIANNIKEYNFDYKSAKGSILSGFNIKDLKYKGAELSSSVDFKFNPIKLLKGDISISKLHLEDVNKQTLTNVINDFKSKKNSTSSNNNIGLNFEFKDILLTIKPFSYDTLIVNKNRLEIEYLSFIDGEFNLGSSRYYYKTNFGDIDFVGKFVNRVLYIEQINLLNLDMKKLISFINSFKNSGNKDKNSSSNTIALLPKEISLSSVNITLKPFKLKGVSAKDIVIKGHNVLFNVDKTKLNRADLNISYRSNLANILTSLNFNKNILNINSTNIDILQANKIDSIIKEYATKESNKSSKNLNILSIFPIKKVILNKAEFNVKNYNLKKESIKELKANILDLNYDLNTTKLSLDDINLKLKSSLLDLNVTASINNKIVIDNLVANSNNLDKLKELISFKSDNKKSTNIDIPKEVIIKKSIFSFKRLSFLPYKIKKGKIKANNLDINISKFNINRGDLELYSLSNWGETSLSGVIKNSNLYANGECKIYEELLNRYSIPLNAKNLKPLKIKGRFGLNSLELNTTLEGNNILTKVDGFDIINSKNIVKYNYSNSNTYWSIDALIKTPYTNKATLKNILVYNKKVSYKGSLKPIKSLESLKSYNEVLGDLEAKFKGDSSYIDLYFNSKKLKGELTSKEYKGGLLKIVNKEDIKLNSLVNLGDNFKNISINSLEIKTPINFKKLLPIDASLNIKSNLVDINGKIGFKDNFYAKLNLINPKNSLKVKNLNIKTFFPLKVDITRKKESKIYLKNRLFSSTINYKTDNQSLNFKLNSKTLNIDAKGKIDNLKGDIKSKNIYSTLKEINRFYKIKTIPNISGAINTKIFIKDFKKINIVASSNKIVYKDKQNSTKLENVLLDISYIKNSLTLNRYKVKVKGYRVFSNRGSKILLSKDKLTFNKFWINDSAILNGNYFLNSKKAKFTLKASNFKINSSDANMNLKLNNKILIDKNRYYIIGVVNILSAVIKKNITNKKVSDNDDIIILQKQNKKKSTKYAKNFKLDLKLISKNGIVYSQGGSYFKMYPKLKINKRYGSLTAVSGVINLDKKSYYKFKDKKLKLKKGVITFKGKSSTPYLNIVMLYSGKEYKIYINISGTPGRPILYFSSNPPLTKDEILAYLLFGDSGAAGTHSQESMLNLIGGTLAKSFFGAMGVKIDHISIKENGFSIGKSINDKITIFYSQDGDKPSIKTRIDITKSIHTDIEVGEDSQSADIIFSKEY